MNTQEIEETREELDFLKQLVKKEGLKEEDLKNFKKQIKELEELLSDSEDIPAYKAVEPPKAEPPQKPTKKGNGKKGSGKAAASGKKSEKPKAPPKPKAEKKENKKATPKPQEKVKTPSFVPTDSAVPHIKSFLRIVQGKQKGVRVKMENLLKRIQKAQNEGSLRKTTKYKDQIEYIQEEVTRFIESNETSFEKGMGEEGKRLFSVFGEFLNDKNKLNKHPLVTALNSFTAAKGKELSQAGKEKIIKSIEKAKDKTEDSEKRLLALADKAIKELKATEGVLRISTQTLDGIQHAHLPRCAHAQSSQCTCKGCNGRKSGFKGLLLGTVSCICKHCN